MSVQEQKNPEKLTTGPKPTEDEEYDVYLFWPSLSSRDVSSGPGDTPSSPLYGPVSLHSESTEYDYSGLSSGPPSPITFAPTGPTLEFQSPMALDFDTAPSDSPEAGAEVEPPKEQKTSVPAKYSPIFQLGLFLSQMSHLVNRAIDGVKIKTRKPRSQAP